MISPRTKTGVLKDINNDDYNRHALTLGKGEPPHVVYFMLLQLGKILGSVP